MRERPEGERPRDEERGVRENGRRCELENAHARRAGEKRSQRTAARSAHAAVCFTRSAIPKTRPAAANAACRAAPLGALEKQDASEKERREKRLRPEGRALGVNGEQRTRSGIPRSKSGQRATTRSASRSCAEDDESRRSRRGRARGWRAGRAPRSPTRRAGGGRHEDEKRRVREEDLVVEPQAAGHEPRGCDDLRPRRHGDEERQGPGQERRERGGRGGHVRRLQEGR